MIRVVMILALLIVAFSMTPATADAQAPYTFTLIADQVSCAFPCEGYLPGLAWERFHWIGVACTGWAAVAIAAAVLAPGGVRTMA